MATWSLRLYTRRSLTAVAQRLHVLREALADLATDAGDAYLRDYYAFTGPFAEKIAAGNLTSGRAVKDYVRGYQEAGCDHLVLLPTVSDPAQLDRLADVLA